MTIHVVKEGDTVEKIAAAAGVGVWQLIYDNQLIYPYGLAVGQALLINNETAAPDRTVSISGYAYPYINPWVLNETLPFLSELSVFSYGFTMTGELVFPKWDDVWMTEAALASGVMPTLTLTPFGPDGNFNNQLIHSVVNHAAFTERLIQELLLVMKQKGYLGLNIDFEYILAEDKDAFAGFVWWVADVMRANGYHTSVALAPKASPEQTGPLHGGQDYAQLGAAADSVFLMTYEWGYTYGPPMAVAPLDKVREVVEYAVTQIPPEKIDLGIPNYGYDWPLPFVRGSTRARVAGNVEAVQLAVEKGAVIQFDEKAMSPYFYYWENEVRHEVWFEDVRSLLEKFRLIKEFRLRGCGYWQIMQWFRANWLLLESQFFIQKEGFREL